MMRNTYPEPVCPYAKIVQLTPSKTSRTFCRATTSNNCSCFTLAPKI